MKIGLIDIDGKLPNLALMKISGFYKSIGATVEFVQDNVNYDRIFGSCLFTWNKVKCIELKNKYGDLISIGGTGWDFEDINGRLIQVHHTVLPVYIENSIPDYNLYTPELVYDHIRFGVGKKEKKLIKASIISNMGLGRTSKGCVRACEFCLVNRHEGCFKQVGEIKDIIHVDRYGKPVSNVITLLDNNLTADNLCIDKLKEIADRKLIVDISQGIDVRLLTDEKAYALSKVKHLRSLHYAWDLMSFEKSVIDGIKLLKKYIKPYRHMCYMLTAFNTSFEEDMYRFKKLLDLKISPFVMINNHMGTKTHHYFARWVNSRFYKVCDFKDYEPYVKYLKEGVNAHRSIA